MKPKLLNEEELDAIWFEANLLAEGADEATGKHDLRKLNIAVDGLQTIVERLRAHDTAKTLEKGKK